MPSGTLVVIGSGPGIGTTTAAHFASQGFQKIALLSRDATRIQSDVKEVRNAAPNATVKSYAVDVADTHALQQTLRSTESDLGDPEVVIFNAARIAESKVGEESPDSVLKDFQMMGVGLYVSATWAMPHLINARGKRGWKPCFFLSGGAVHDDPGPQVFSLCMCKGAQHNLMKTLWKEYGAQGVHVALVNIGGVVQDSDPAMNRGNIARKYWELYEEPKGKFRFHADIPEGIERFDLDQQQ